MTTDEMTVIKMISPDCHWKVDMQTIGSETHVKCLRTNMIFNICNCNDCTAYFEYSNYGEHIDGKYTFTLVARNGPT